MIDRILSTLCGRISNREEKGNAFISFHFRINLKLFGFSGRTKQALSLELAVASFGPITLDFHSAPDDTIILLGSPSATQTSPSWHRRYSDTRSFNLAHIHSLSHPCKAYYTVFLLSATYTGRTEIPLPSTFIRDRSANAISPSTARNTVPFGSAFRYKESRSNRSSYTPEQRSPKPIVLQLISISTKALGTEQT